MLKGVGRRGGTGMGLVGGGGGVVGGLPCGPEGWREDVVEEWEVWWGGGGY